MARGNIGVDLPNLFKLAGDVRGQEIDFDERERAIGQRNQIEEILRGANLDDRQDVMQRLQAVAPAQALEFGQKTRGQPKEDLEFNAFVSQRLATMLDNVKDQKGFDQAREFALKIGFPQEVVDLAGKDFDPARVKQIAEQLRTVTPASMAKQQDFDPPTQVPGAPKGTIGQRNKKTNQFEVLIKPKDVARTGKKFGKIEQVPGAPAGTMGQENLDTGEFKVKARPPSGGEKGRASTSNMNALRSRVADMFGGLYDPFTGAFTFQDKESGLKSAKILAKAERLFIENPKLTPSEAVLAATGEDESPAKVKRRRLETPGGALTDVK